MILSLHELIRKLGVRFRLGECHSCTYADGKDFYAFLPAKGRLSSMLKLGIVILQVCFLHVFLFLGMALKHIFPLPIPASMFGLFLLFLALYCNIIKLEWVEQGAKWLMAELLLFFIPSAVGIVNYEQIISIQGFEIVILIAISTMIVMGMTAITAERISVRKRSERH